jgi:hypothetical protein
MVPLLPIKLFATQSCAEVKRVSFSNHANCYLNPQHGAPSICNVAISDLWQVFWTVKDAFTTAFQDSLFTLYKVSTFLYLESSVC